jgi:hypothetical protein
VIAVTSRAADLERHQLRHLLGRVPDGMTPDEALEKRMALLRQNEKRAGRGVAAIVWLGAVLVDVLVLVRVFASGG